MPRKSAKSDIAAEATETVAPAPAKKAKAPAKPRAKKASAETAPVVALELTGDQVASEAYLLWLAEGQPIGRDLEHWLLAEQIVRSRLSLLSAAVHSA